MQSTLPMLNFVIIVLITILAVTGLIISLVAPKNPKYFYGVFEWIRNHYFRYMFGILSLWMLIILVLIRDVL